MGPLLTRRLRRTNVHNPSSIQRIAIIGFGEVGGIFANDLAKQGIDVSVFDILLVSKRHRRQMLSKARSCSVRAVDGLSNCVRGAGLVISAVTASSALAVAREAGPLLERGQIFLDINSVSPETKCTAARYVERNGAHFVEAAVMDPVPRHRLRVPLLLGGSCAVEASEQLRSIGINATALSDQIGVASALKMCRSVMIKGLEALTVECLFAARQYGAEDAVLESLAATYPGMGWKDDLPDYLISRVAEHGRRRAAEMREAAQALKDVGVEPKMALATAERQEWLVDAISDKKASFQASEPFSWRSLSAAVVRSAGRRSSRKDNGRTHQRRVSGSGHGGSSLRERRHS
jgi:3-hydroxyisobutyrate dehydrogenase-like beta-hydroxyacid dehydrogenase